MQGVYVHHGSCDDQRLPGRKISSSHQQRDHMDDHYYEYHSVKKKEKGGGVEGRGGSYEGNGHPVEGGYGGIESNKKLIGGSIEGWRRYTEPNKKGCGPVEGGYGT